MSDLMTDSQQTNSRVFKSPLVSFSTVTDLRPIRQWHEAVPRREP